MFGGAHSNVESHAAGGESEAERLARFVQGANRSIDSIRHSYEDHQRTPQQRKDKFVDAGKNLLDRFEEKYRQGKATWATLQNFRSSHQRVRNFPIESFEHKDRTASWTFNDTEYGEITITNEGSKFWRKATVDDVGSIVMFYDYMADDSKMPLFGKFHDIIEEPDEEFPEECTKFVAFVITQFSELWRNDYEGGGVYDNMFVVPETVLRGVRNEAPPGSFFSGKAIPNSTEWSPAPDGKVWYDHPSLKGPPQYFTDFEYFCLKRRCARCAGVSPMCVPFEAKLYEQQGRFQYWCPVKRKFMCEGEMFRQEHWFHNGDGSAQQRRYYTQNEMLDKYGGLSTLPARYDAATGTPIYSKSGGDDVEVLAVRTVDQVIDEKLKAAVEAGTVIDLAGTDPSESSKKRKRKNGF